MNVSVKQMTVSVKKNGYISEKGYYLLLSRFGMNLK